MNIAYAISEKYNFDCLVTAHKVRVLLQYNFMYFNDLTQCYLSFLICYPCKQCGETDLTPKLKRFKLRIPQFSHRNSFGMDRFT